MSEKVLDKFKCGCPFLHKGDVSKFMKNINSLGIMFVNRACSINKHNSFTINAPIIYNLAKLFVLQYLLTRRHFKVCLLKLTELHDQ